LDIKRNYFEDIQALKSNTSKVWFVILLAGLVAFPFISSNYYVYMINYMAVNIIVAMGLNILIGYTGQISLGHAGFFAIGAYATVLLIDKLHFPFFAALFAAAFIAAAFGFILGLPALRLEGPYLAIATLAFGMAIIQVIGRAAVFGGRNGLLVSKMSLGSWIVNTDKEMYFVIIPITILLVFAARNIVKTRIGRALVSIRDSDIAAETMGVNVTYYKTLAFAISAFYAGIAGGLYAFVIGFINPGSFTFFLSILFLSMVVVGGLGSVLGAVMGGIIISFLNLKLESVQYIPGFGNLLIFISKKWMSVTGLPNISSIIFGLILILIVVIEPLGLYGFWIRTKKYWKTWPF